MVPLKSLITVACTMALVAAGALTGPIVAHSDQVAFGPDASPAEVAARITAGSRSLVVMPDGEICGWGGTLQERGTPAPEPECFWLPGGIAATSISAVTHAVAVGADGVAYTWGSIGSSVAYDPSDESYDVARPVKLPAGAAPVIAVSAGQMYTAVLTEDGAIYTSGHNEYGQLGDGTVVHYSKPWEPGWPSTKVDADGVVFTAVAAGYTHTLALSDEGKVYAWGADESGQLGPNGAFDPDADFDTYGATNPSAWMVSTPVEVPLPGPIVQIAAGYSHSVALSADGHVYTWGWNSYGALGIGKATRFSHVPVKVNIAGVVGIAAGYNTTLAWTADGRLFGWGSNGAGGLGNGTASNEFTPQEALGVRVKAATSSGSYSLAVGTDGQIYTFGENYSYNLGSSELPFTEEPQLVPGLPGPIAYVAAGDSTTLAITQGGDVYTWGDNWCGQLGTGDMDSRVAPTRVVGVTGAVQADIHHGHAAVLTADGEVWAWGSNTSGELGREPGELQESIPTPVKVDLPPEVGQPVLVATGYNFTMLLTEEGEIWGWGNNNPGWFGPASHDPVPQPSLVDTDWDDAATTALSVGGEWVAVALVDGTPYGFGADWSSQIGGRGLVQAKLPIVGLPDKTIVQADTSAYSTAALDQDGDVWTLGRGYDQELGRPYTGDGDPIPKVVDGLHGISAVAAGDTLGMALSGDRGSVYTWGTWGRANLSYYALTDHAYIPVRASGFHDSIKQIAAGKNHAVALTDSGEVYTWGVNSSGQLGYVSPTWVPEIRVVDLQFWDPPETPEPSDTQSTDPGDTGSPTPTDSGSTAPTTSGSPTPSDTGSPTPSDTASTDPTGTGSATPSDSGSAAPTTSGSPTPSNTPSTDPTDTASGDPTDPPATPSAPSDTDSGDETDDPGGPDPGTPPDTGGTAPGTAREDSTDRSDDATGLGTGTSARDPGAASIGGTAPHGTTPRIARFGTRFKTVVIPSGTTAALKVAAYTAAGTQVGPARVTWTTSRASVASPVKGTKTGRVSWRTGSAATLNIKALAAGRTQVTLTSPGARPATIQIKVVLAAKAKAKQLRAVTLTGPATLAAGRSAVLKPVLRPRGAVRTGARWRSTDPAVATVDAVGRVTGIAAGRAVIVLTAGGKTATKTITITANP